MCGRPGDEAGESLVEIVVSVAILGLAVVAIMGGLATAVLGSALHRNQADVSVVMTAAAERVKEAPYAECAVMDSYLGTFDPAVPPSFNLPGHTVTRTSPSRLTVSSIGGSALWTVDFAIADWAGSKVFVPRDVTTCASNHDLGFRLQQITITVATADTKVSKSLSVMKRFGECPPLTPVGIHGCDTP